MNTPQPYSPEDILNDFLIWHWKQFKTGKFEKLGHIPFSHKQQDEAQAKLDEYYTNKFLGLFKDTMLEIVGEDEGLAKTVWEVQPGEGFVKICRNQLRAELRQAIKQLSKNSASLKASKNSAPLNKGKREI